MKAIVVDGEGRAARLALGDVEGPGAPGSDEIVVDIFATAVNRADLLQRRGLYPPPPGASPILGLECAGVVAAVGDGVGRFAPGDRVMALLPGGGYAERVRVHAGSVLPVPNGLSDAEAGGFVETFLTAYLNAFVLGGVGEGRWLLVHGGASGVGTSALALAREDGVRTVVTAGSDAKLARCRELGADRAVCYRNDDFVAACLDATEGRGVDAVLDCVGGSYLDRNLRCLAPGGRLIVIALQGGAKGELDLARLLTRRLEVVGSTLRARSVDDKAEIVRSFVDRFGGALRDGRLRPVIHAALPLERAEDAHAILAAGENVGKVVLTVGS